MKASIRLAAIMRIPSTFVFTHDSIGVGEDGPTHQPIEQLATLRATPNINVVRPAGFNETALAWQFALKATETPTVLALSRQGVPVWDPAGVPADAIERGAYVLKDADGDPELILMGSGTEVHVAHDALKILEAEGVKVRLVSMPCLDRFAAQDQAYRDSVLPPGGARPRRRRGRRARSAGTAGSATTATSSRWRASAPQLPPRRSTSTSASPARTSPSARGRCSARDA